MTNGTENSENQMKSPMSEEAKLSFERWKNQEIFYDILNKVYDEIEYDDDEYVAGLEGDDDYE